MPNVRYVVVLYVYVCIHSDAVTVDMAPNIQAGLLRAIHLLPWRPDSLLAHDHFVWEEVKMFTVPPPKVQLSPGHILLWMESLVLLLHSMCRVAMVTYGVIRQTSLRVLLTCLK